MFDVEKKVFLSTQSLETIERKGTFLGMHLLSDIYFDTPNLRYTTNDIWLRERNCHFELKIGVGGLEGTVCRYEKITEADEILLALGLTCQKDFDQTLKEAEVFPFAMLQTIRRKYQIEEFTLELDLAYFDDFIYRVAKISLPVSNKSYTDEAQDRINVLAKALQIDPSIPIRAKLLEFLAKKNPSHYQALRKAHSPAL